MGQQQETEQKSAFKGENQIVSCYKLPDVSQDFLESIPWTQGRGKWMFLDGLHRKTPDVKRTHLFILTELF